MADNEGANGRASARIKTVPRRAAAASTASGNAGSILPRGGPAVAMVVVVSAALSAVVYAHYSQVRDKAVMRAGVERDKERLRLTRQQ
jgi:PET assembly of cytochrome c oxidase, mitochondrial